MFAKPKYAKARLEARSARTDAVAATAAHAFAALARRRAGSPTPAAFVEPAHPWTLDYARLLARGVEARLEAGADWPGRHRVACEGAAGRTGLTADAPGERLLAPAWLGDVAWRVEREDGAALSDVALVARLVWRGGWPELAGACDELAACRARLRVIAANADPGCAVGEMTLAEALAFRIAAFAPKGEAVLLAFFGGPGGWREADGFTVFDYVCGARDLTPRA